MVDLVKFNTPPLPARGNVIDLATALPLATGHSLGKNKSFSTPFLKVELGTPKTRFGTLMFMEFPDGTPRLVSIEGNLPKLLFGHNGRLIRNQEGLVLALSRLRWMAGHFVLPELQKDLLPGLGRSGHLARIEIALQLWDLKKQILLASHLTGCRGFRNAPLVAAGESTTHSSNDLDICFYDKRRQLKQGTVHPPRFSCTRIETRFRTNKRLIRAAAQSAPKHFGKVATFSFLWLFETFRNTIAASLMGTLARAKPTAVRNLRPASLSIIDLVDPVLINTALAEHQLKHGRGEGSRTKCEVLDEFSRRYLGSLEEILAHGYPQHIVSEVEIPEVERAHQITGKMFGWPDEPSADVASVFSRTMYLDARGAPRHFVLPL